MSRGTKVDFRCRLSEHTCNFPVCAVLSQRTPPREHTDIKSITHFYDEVYFVTHRQSVYP